MKVLSNKETCKPTNISGTAARREMVQLWLETLNTNLAWKQSQLPSRVLVGRGHLWAVVRSGDR